MRSMIAGIVVASCVFASQAIAQDNPEAYKAYRACFGEAAVDARIEGCNKAIGLGSNYNPKEFNQILNNRGTGFMQRHQFELAIKDFDMAIRVYLRAIPPYVNRANAKMRTGKFAEGLQDAQHVLDEDPSQPNALALRCFLVAATDAEPEHAVPLCAQSLKQRPDNSTTLAGRALALYRLGKYQEALQDCEKGLRKDGRDDQLLFMQGITKIKLGNTSGGNADIAAAVALHPDIKDSFPAAIAQSVP